MLLISIEQMLSFKATQMIPVKCDYCQQNFEKMQRLCTLEIESLNAIIDLQEYSIPSIKLATTLGRYLGVGINGFATFAASLGLDGTEVFSIDGVTELNSGVTPKTLKVVASPTSHSAAGKTDIVFDVALRIDTPGEADYYRHGGILQYVLRSLVG
mgnify:CR=1 FL=1